MIELKRNEIVVVGEAKAEEGTKRLRELWADVIQQAVAEAEGRQLYGVPKEEIEGCKRRARKWLTHDSRSFRETCGYAGLTVEAREEILANAGDEAWRKRFLELYRQNKSRGKDDRGQGAGDIEDAVGFGDVSVRSDEGGKEFDYGTAGNEGVQGLRNPAGVLDGSTQGCAGE